MAETLFPQAAQLAATASEGAGSLNREKVAATNSAQNNLASTGQQASSQMEAQKLEQQKAEAAQKLEEMKIAAGQTEIDPEIAMGLSKNTGNPGYLQMIGHKIPTKALFVMYSSDMKMSTEKDKAENTPPKTFKAYDKNGREQTYEHVKDEQGNWTVQPLAGSKAPPPAKSSSAKDSTEQKKKDAAALLKQIQGATDDSAKEALVASYNNYASDKSLGLIPYSEEPGFFEKAKAAIGSVVHSVEGIISKNHKEQPSAADSVAGKFGF